MGYPLSEGESFCALHAMKLAIQIHAFCSKFVDPEPDDKGDWLDQMLGTREGLKDDMMYIWLGGYEIKYFHVPLTSIAEYANWTQERFFEELATLTDKHRTQLGRE